jgi:hypothetical protein
MHRLPLLVLLFGCGNAAEDSTCRDLCIELVTNCEYAAFPSVESCQQGCEYNAVQGADIEGQSECVIAAECDTFAIVECEHVFGLEAATEPQ